VRLGKRQTLKHLALVTVAGFLAFAPPGTLILLSGLAVGLFGWIAVGAGLAVLAATAGVWFTWKRFRRKSDDCSAGGNIE
jgi:hypothetical protein